VRNALPGRVTKITADGEHADLLEVDVGGARLLARVTGLARRELGLKPGSSVWALVKAVSIRGHVR